MNARAISIFGALAVTALSSTAPISATAQAPADYGPVSADVAEIPYPYPVSTLSFVLFGKDVRMAYMDVKPAGTPNGRTVVLLHGFNFFGEAWAGTIDALTREGFRVIVPDQIGFGRSSKPAPSLRCCPRRPSSTTGRTSRAGTQRRRIDSRGSARAHRKRGTRASVRGAGDLLPQTRAVLEVAARVS